MESKVQLGIVQTGTSVWHPVDERKPVTESEPSPSDHKEAPGDTFESGGAPGARHGNVEFNF